MRLPTWVVVLAVTLASTLAACSPGLTDDGAERLTLADGSEALRWGDGEYGVVLLAGEGEDAGDWVPLAREIAANRMTAVAVEAVDVTPGRLVADVTPGRLAMAAAWLMSTGIERVAYVASGSDGASLLVAHARSGGAIDQLILISGAMTDAELADLGEPPKLFAATEGDPAGSDMAAHMADTAAGTWNALLLVPGADHGLAILDGEGAAELIAGVVARLEERR